jgi:hypothetical protein
VSVISLRVDADATKAGGSWILLYYWLGCEERLMTVELFSDITPK